MDIQTIAGVAHLFGVALGAGGAYLSDMMFFSSVRDEKISGTEMRFLKLGSFAVWIGLFILIVSGLVLTFLNPERTIGSEKFWAKMTIVAVIIVNGLIFKHYHLPHLHKHIGLHFPSSAEFVRRIPLLLISGAISGVSWSAALILGALRRLPYGYWEIMSAYLALVVLTIFFVIVFKKKLIAHPK